MDLFQKIYYPITLIMGRPEISFLIGLFWYIISRYLNNGKWIRWASYIWFFYAIWEIMIGAYPIHNIRPDLLIIAPILIFITIVAIYLCCFQLIPKLNVHFLL